MEEFSAACCGVLQCALEKVNSREHLPRLFIKGNGKKMPF
jgi:hypothetical protein